MTQIRFKSKPFFNNFSDDLFQNFPSLLRDGQNGYNLKHSTPVNVIESEGGYQLEVVAPGMNKEDFSIQLENNILTVAVEKKTEEERKEQKFIRREYSFQSFKRSFTIDEKNIDAANISARYVNGVLTLNLPRKEDVKASAKQITIQ
jgi:HSP20 family protein